MAVLANDEAYSVGDGRRGKLSRETSPYHGGNGAGGAVCQARIVWTGRVIRQKVGKLDYQVNEFARRTS